MSHFTVGAILPKDGMGDGGAIEAHLNKVLERYSENKEVEPYDKPCYCVGLDARMAARQAADKEAGSMDELRTAFWLVHKGEAEGSTRDSAWKAHIAGWEAAERRALESHPLKDKPHTDCEECHGTGTTKSTYNPDSKWDWWCIGGRWAGRMVGYEPSEDPRNYEKCTLCDGTGTRTMPVPGSTRPPEGWSPDFKKADPAGHPVIGDGCNGCMGTGFQLTSSSKWKAPDGDCAEVEKILSAPELFVPFALLTPEGEWIERGKMGWWAMVSDEKDKEEWTAAVRFVYEKYREHVMVLLDCHI